MAATTGILIFRLFPCARFRTRGLHTLRDSWNASLHSRLSAFVPQNHQYGKTNNGVSQWKTSPGAWNSSRQLSTVPSTEPTSDDAKVQERLPSRNAPVIGSASYFRTMVKTDTLTKKAKRTDWSQYKNPDAPEVPPPTADDFGVKKRGATKESPQDDIAGPNLGQAVEFDSPSESGKEIISRRRIVKGSRSDLVEPETDESLPSDKSVVRHRRSAKAQVEVLHSTRSITDSLDDIDWDEIEKHDPERRPFEVIPDTDPSLAEVAPALPPFSYNLATYANKSENIEKLVELGVDVWKFDQDTEISQRIITADWDNKIQPYLDFMIEIGVAEADLQGVLSKHPRFLKESLTDLQAMVDYFLSKKFPKDAIARILVKAPLAFSLSVRHVDKKLGRVQHDFKLTGPEVRQVIAQRPKIIIRNEMELTVMRLAMINEMGFTKEETKAMFLDKPQVFQNKKHTIVNRFDYLHNVVNISHLLLVQYPGCLITRKYKVRERHLFLKSMKRDQYNPELPNYVSLQALCIGKDSEFCANVAKTPTRMFNEFIKTL